MIYIVYITWIALQLLVTVSACVGIMLIFHFVLERWKIKRQHKQWEKEYAKLMQRWDEENKERERRHQERELYRIEKRKYPLFYWRENS